jgi:hypothetical protein
MALQWRLPLGARREVSAATVTGYPLRGPRRLRRVVVWAHCVDSDWPWWSERAYRRAIWGTW